jgi:hypothetical protein
MAFPAAGALSLLLAAFCPIFAARSQNPKPPAQAANGPVPAVSNISYAAPKPSPEATAPAPSLSLSPGVIMLNARPGQSTTQQLSISNLTSAELGFELEAVDVAVRDGKRVFVHAGELQGSIARTAVFSPQFIVVQPGATSTVSVTLTIPESPATRAMVAVFRGKTVIQGHGAVGMTASLGALLTFNLSDQIKLESSAIQFAGTSAGDSLAISEWVTNTGSEPAVAKGVIAILKSGGSLVGKVPVDGKRLLPGEHLEFKAEYPSTLKQGKYRAVISLEHAGGVLTTTSEFDIQ